MSLEGSVFFRPKYKGKYIPNLPFINCNMRWYKFSVVLAIGLLVELVVAIFSTLLVKENGEWLASLTLPYFAPHSPLFYGSLMVIDYLSTVVSLAFFTETLRDLPKGLLLIGIEGIFEIITLLLFFEFTYEITSFFSATATLLFSIYGTSVFLSKSDAAGIAKIPNLQVKLYLWTVLYCILSINFA